jgi:tetratricopeptide (TPR) repeat protein
MRNIRWVADQIHRIRPKSAEYYTVNSLILFYDWRFDEAIAEVERALSRKPDFARARAFHAWYVLLSRGDVATAYREYPAAELDDPKDVIIQCHKVNPYYFDRKFPQAIDLMQQTLGFYPNTILGHKLLGQYYEAYGLFTNALDEYEKSDKLSGNDVAQVEADYAQQRANLKEKGPVGWRRAKLEEAKKAPKPDYCELAALCARLSDRAGALDYLEKAFRAHEQDMIFLLYDDCWDLLRNDEQFQDIVARVGFKPKR